MAATRDPWDYFAMRRRKIVLTVKFSMPFTTPINIPAELLPDIEEQVVQSLVAAMRHVQDLGELPRP